VETGYLPVIGLRNITRHVAAVLERKAAGEVIHHVQCNQTLSTEQSRLDAGWCICILLNFFYPLTAVECGGVKQG